MGILSCDRQTCKKLGYLDDILQNHPRQSRDYLCGGKPNKSGYTGEKRKEHGVRHSPQDQNIDQGRDYGNPFEIKNQQRQSKHLRRQSRHEVGAQTEDIGKTIKPFFKDRGEIDEKWFY